MKRHTFVICSFVFTLLFTLFSAAEETIVRGRFAKIDITPTKPANLSGYSNRKDLSTGIHDSLSARISVFQSGENKIILVSSDIIDFYNGTSAFFRRELLDEFHLQSLVLFLSSIHTHDYFG
jgi:hypothetical protein